MKQLLLISIFCMSPIFSMITPSHEDDVWSEMCLTAAASNKLSWLKALRASRTINPDIVSMPNAQGTTPLFIACQEGHVDIVKYLIEEFGTQVNQQFLFRQPTGDQVPCTALHMAAARGHTKIAKLLLDAGADKDSQHAPKKRTPLLYAIAHAHIEIVKILICAGADPGIADEDNVTAINLAPKRWVHLLETPKGCEIIDVCIVLREALNKCDMIRAAKMGNLTILQRLINQKANLEIIDAHDQATPLIWAANTGQIEAVWLLLKAGANIHAKNKDGYTALDCARKSNPYIVDMLERELKESPAFDDKGKEELL